MHVGCPAGGPEPNTQCVGPAQRLRKPPIGSELPTQAAPLSIAAPRSIQYPMAIFTEAVAQSQCGRPPPRTHLRWAMRRNHCASKLTHSERPGHTKKGLPMTWAAPIAYPSIHTELIMTRCWYINVKEWEQPCERNPKQAEIKRFSHVTAQWGDSAAP